MSETVLIPGGRDVRASLDSPGADACVVACPPHPQLGGKRSDRRLRGVADVLSGTAPDGDATRPAVATLRFDYASWDEGTGEVADARSALSWAHDRYEPVGLFGYSFGGGIALLAAARESRVDRAPVAVAALAPSARPGRLAAAAAIGDIECPGYVLYGERDTTAEWEPVVERAREAGWRVESMAVDHHFVRQTDTVGRRCGAFLRTVMGY
ncbi:dienelactone hydrolase family protein [Halosegnis sp.]|uniref:dienelactone hydrolase family protein n=1 Tax=Halosegnis sp. TaxID=2864959 RepID=UPI0035D4FD5C